MKEIILRDGHTLYKTAFYPAMNCFVGIAKAEKIGNKYRYTIFLHSENKNNTFLCWDHELTSFCL